MLSSTLRSVDNLSKENDTERVLKGIKMLKEGVLCQKNTIHEQFEGLRVLVEYDKITAFLDKITEVIENPNKINISFRPSIHTEFKTYESEEFKRLSELILNNNIGEIADEIKQSYENDKINAYDVEKLANQLKKKNDKDPSLV